MVKKTFINLGFDLLKVYEPISGIVKTIYDSYEASQADKKINEIQNQIESIKKSLGLSKVELCDSEIAFVKMFLDKSNKDSTALEYITLDYDELFENLQLSENDFKDVIMSFESNNFIEWQKHIGGHGFIKLSFSIFWHTNILEIISDNSLSFEHILKIVTDYLYDSHRHNNEALRTNEIIKEMSLNEFLVNPILSFYSLHNIIRPYHSWGNLSSICTDFQIINSNLYTLHKDFNQKD